MEPPVRALVVAHNLNNPEGAPRYLSEIVLGPIWAWLGVGEVPSPMTLLGGAIVIGALFWQTLSAQRGRS